MANLVYRAARPPGSATTFVTPTVILAQRRLAPLILMSLLTRTFTTASLRSPSAQSVSSFHTSTINYMLIVYLDVSSTQPWSRQVWCFPPPADLHHPPSHPYKNITNHILLTQSKDGLDLRESRLVFPFIVFLSVLFILISCVGIVGLIGSLVDHLG